MNSIVCKKWPVPYLEEEIWLRTRRLAVCQLSARGYWPQLSDYQKYMREQEQLGRRIKDSVLREILGELDFAHLNSETVFNVNNHHFRSRLPYMAAFGFQTSTVIHHFLHCRSEDAKPIAELCSLFNIGISILDHLIDNEPDMSTKIKDMVGEEKISAMCDCTDSIDSLMKDCEKADSAEIRILCKITGTFFQRLHTMHSYSSHSGEFKQTLHASYKAEMVAGSKVLKFESEMFEAGRAKSCLPFVVMYELTKLSPDISTEKDDDSFITTLGEIFWLVDDLSDIIDDWQSNRVNAVIAKVLADDCMSVAENDKVAQLIALLSSDYIESTVELLCNKITYVINSLDSRALVEKDRVLVEDFIYAYVRDWLR